MGSERYLLGIDLGTTTCRCAIFDRQGNEAAIACRETPVHYPRQLWAEMDPRAWWQSTVQVVRDALAGSGVTPAQIAAVGLSGLMHAPVLLDGDGQPVIPAMLWMDQRCAPQCEALNREAAALGLDDMPHFSPTLTAPKLRWLADTHPDLLARAQTLVLPKDFVRYRLTGTIGTDPSDASGTGLFDRRRGEWSAQAARLARVPPQILPPIYPSHMPAGGVTPAAAQETGLAPGTVVAVGGGDTLCTQLAIGPIAPGEFCIYLGTAAWVARVQDLTPDGRPIFGSFGASATTGAALRWIRDLLATAEHPGLLASYDALTRQAQDVAPGAEGLFFLPHLMGERGPLADPLARGALVGLTLRHSQAQIVRAILEGTAFHLRRLIEAQADDRPPIAGVACGGAARSPFWMQLLADVTHLPLQTPAVVEAGALGAAMLGGLAAGVISPEATAHMARSGQVYSPNAALTERYDALYARYCQLDDLLAPWFRQAGDEL